MNEYETIISGAPPKRGYGVDLYTDKQILFAPINASASGDNTLVAAVGNRKINVLSYIFVCAGTVNITFKSGSTALSGAMPMVANSGVVSQMSSPGQGPIFQTVTGDALILNLSQAVSTTGHLSYYLE